MSDISSTRVKTNLGGSAFAGTGEKVLVYTVTPSSASDTITLTVADDEVREVKSVIGAPQIVAGADANLLVATATVTDTLEVTIVTYGADGGAATDWTGASIEIALLCGL